VNRAFSAGGLSSSKNPGALPQVRHGESVLWRTNDETAPFDAKQTASDTEAVTINRVTIWRTNHAWPEAPQYIPVYSSSRAAQLLRGSFVVKSSFQKQIHAVEIDNGVAIVERVHPEDPSDSGGALSQREIR
jgi:hypothetical protein